MENNVGCFSGTKILIVDDNILNQKLLEGYLRKFSCTIKSCNNGEEALEMVEKNSFDLIFMDIQMPMMDGYTATTFMREKHKLITPIIGLSASDTKEDIEGCMNCGMNDFMRKPFSQDQLYEKLNKWAKQLDSGEIKAPSESCYDSRLKNIVNNDSEMAKDIISDLTKLLKDFKEKIFQAKEEKNWEQIRFLSHKMKSSLNLLGFTEMGNTLTEVENFCKNKENLDQIPVLFDNISRLYDEVMIALKKEMEYYAR